MQPLLACQELIVRRIQILARLIYSFRPWPGDAWPKCGFGPGASPQTLATGKLATEYSQLGHPLPGKRWKGTPTRPVGCPGDALASGKSDHYDGIILSAVTAIQRMQCKAHRDSLTFIRHQRKLNLSVSHP